MKKMNVFGQPLNSTTLWNIVSYFTGTMYYTQRNFLNKTNKNYSSKYN